MTFKHTSHSFPVTVTQRSFIYQLLFCPEHPFSHLIDTLRSEQYEERRYFNPQKLSDVRYGKLLNALMELNHAQMQETSKKCVIKLNRLQM